MTPECTLWQELGLSTEARSISRGEGAWSEVGGASRENGAVSAGRSGGLGSGGWAASGGIVCVVSPGGDSQGVTVW